MNLLIGERNRRRLALTVIAGVSLGACGGSSEQAAPATEAAPVTDAAPPTTVPPTTVPPTSAAPTTAPAAEPIEGVTGLVWASAVSDDRINTDTPQPTYEADGITSRIESVFWVESGRTNDLQQECREDANSEQELAGGELATECLTVQWAFDVPADFPTEDFSGVGGLVLVTPEGKQIDSIFGANGSPGTVDNRLVVTFPGGVPGSTLRFDTGSNLNGWDTHVYEVPSAELFRPLTSKYSYEPLEGHSSR
jgi:hypothetical protein